VTKATPPRYLRIDCQAGVATVNFDRPPVNAIDHKVIDEFSTAVDRLALDAAVRAVVIAGTARSFSAGGDLAVLRDLSVDNHLRLRRWVDVLTNLERMQKPTIAAIRGYALGGGADLALACDIRFMGDGASIGYPEVEHGLFPATGGTQRLSRLVGPARALKLMIDGVRIPAREAERLGLAHEVVPDSEVLPVTIAYARALAQGPTKAIALLKRCVYTQSERGRDDKLEETCLLDLISTHDAEEGLAAFLERRTPHYNGT
jgi:enoyl-CoA hydratase